MIFTITAFLIILWALGYRYDFKYRKIQKIGIISLRTTPRKDIKIYLKEKLLKRTKTPLEISNLLPGNYNLRIEKDGFHSWEKTLKVEPNGITREEAIVLFLKNPNITRLQESVVNFEVSPNYKKIASIKSSKENMSIWIYDLNRQKEINVFSLSSKSDSDLKISSISWSPDNSKILFKERGNFRIINTENTKENFFINKPHFENLFWNPTTSNEVLGIVAGKLWSWNLQNQKSNQITSENIISFSGSKNQNRIYYTTFNLNRKQSTLYQVNYSGQNKEEILKIDEKIIRILPNPELNFLALISSKNNLYIMNLNNKTAARIKENIKNPFWSEKGKKLIYNTDYELWVFYLKKEEVEVSLNQLVSRFGDEKIENICFYPDFEHIVFSQSKGIFVIEFDGTNLVELVNKNLINSKISPGSEEKKNLFLLDKEDNKINLYFLETTKPDSGFLLF